MRQRTASNVLVWIRSSPVRMWFVNGLWHKHWNAQFAVGIKIDWRFTGGGMFVPFELSKAALMFHQLIAFNLLADASRH